MTYDLYLDISKNSVPFKPNPVIYGRIGDAGLQSVTVHVFDKGEVFNLSGLTLSFNGMTPNGARFSDTGGVTNLNTTTGTFLYTFPKHVFDSVGVFKLAHFTLASTLGQVTTQDFSLHVLNTVDMTAKEAEAILIGYNQLVTQLQDIANQFKEDLKDQAHEELRTLHALIHEFIQDPAWDRMEELAQAFESLKTEIESVTAQLANEIRQDYEERLKVIHQTINETQLQVDQLKLQIEMNDIVTQDELTTAIHTRAPSSHTHAINEVTNLQTSLDTKLNVMGGTLFGDVTSTSRIQSNHGDGLLAGNQNNTNESIGLSFINDIPRLRGYNVSANTPFQIQGSSNVVRFSVTNTHAEVPGTFTAGGDIRAPNLIGDADRLGYKSVTNWSQFGTAWQNLPSGCATVVHSSDSATAGGPLGSRYAQGILFKYDNASGGNGLVVGFDGVANANQPALLIKKLRSGSWGSWVRLVDEDGGVAVSATRLVKQGWFNLTPLNGTTAHSEFSIPQYCKIGDVVYLRGAFRGIRGSGTICAILPEGYRPVGQDQSVVQNTSVFGNSTYFARWVVRTNGEIELWRINRPDGYVAGNWFPIHTSFVIG